MVEKLLKRVVERRGGRLPVFTLVMGDEESDDKMFEVFFLLLLFICI
jgi:hypothetical protein